MASTNQKVPIPLPVAGVVKDQNPRTLGPNALVDAKNWVFRDGMFTVRDGIVPLIDAGENLIPTDDLAKMDKAAALFYSGTPLEWETFQELRYSKRWYTKDQTDFANFSTPNWISQGTWQIGDPTFLSFTSGKYCKITQHEDLLNEFGFDYFEIASPVLSARQVPYAAQIQIAGDNGTTSRCWIKMFGMKMIEHPNKTYSFTPIGEDGLEDLTWGNSYVDWMTKDLEGQNQGWVEATGPWANNDPSYCYFDNTEANADFVVLVVRFYGPINAYWGIANSMLYEGYGEQPYRLPSDVGVGDQIINERPMGFTEFEQAKDNYITVIGTDVGLHVVNNDFTMTPVTDGIWMDSTDDNDPLPATSNDQLVVFRVFESDKRYLIAVNGEGVALEWDGSGDADIVGGGGALGNYIIAKCVAVCFNRVLYGNVKGTISTATETYPDGVTVTDAYTHDECAIDGFTVRLADTPGHIVAMLEMGSMQTVVYKTDGIYMAIGQGLDPCFRFELRAAGVAGPVSPLAVVSLSDGVHAYLSNTGDVIIFDGVRPHSMGQHIQAYVQKTIDTDRAGESFGFYDKQRKELYFLYPGYGAGEAFCCVMINVSQESSTLWPLRWWDAVTAAGTTHLNLSKTIGQLGGEIRDYAGMLIGDFARFRPATIMVDIDGRPLVFQGNSDWRGPIDAYMQTGVYDLGNQTQFKTVHEIDHIFHADPSQEITVELLISDYGKEERKDGEREIDLDTTGPKVTRHRATGRMFSLRFSTESTGLIEWLGSEASISIRGYR